MKKSILAVIVVIFTLICVEAQELTLNPDVRYGKLENGLTYYILHNEEPKERASFYIIQNVGAMLEEDDQNGLAHFLEHMAFNGTKNFPKKGIIKYLEKYGVAFGRNINAYTSTDETVYNISGVPTTHEPLLDSCLLVLHDWSNFLSLEPEEVDAERGVIREEWRTRRTPTRLTWKQERQNLLAGTKYAKRDVIGSLDVINNFEHDALRKFYHNWYRTDLQAIAIVGDIDVDQIEEKIKNLFSKIPAVENPKERVFYDVPDNDEPIYSLVTNKELKGSSISISSKYKATPAGQKDYNYLRNNYVRSLFTQLLNQRLSERLQDDVPPFLGSQLGYSGMTRTLFTARFYVSFKENQWKSALTEAVREFERVKDFGFTQSELDRKKTNWLKSSENSYKRRDEINNDQHVSSIKNNYLLGSPFTGPEFIYKFAQKEIPSISLEEINAMAKLWFTDKNLLISVKGPEKEGVTYPSMEEILGVVQAVQNEKLEPYVDSYEDKPLVENLGKGSKIIATNKIEELDATEFKLENGAIVVVKQTDFDKNNISFSAYSNGGSSLYTDDVVPTITVFNSFIGQYGVGAFSPTDLGKALTGKTVKVYPSLNTYYEQFSGSSSPEDLETLLQLTYLYFENPRFDEGAYESYMKRYRATNANWGKDAATVFGDSISTISSNRHPRVKPFRISTLDHVSYEKIEQIYRERFVDASDFKFFFVGNIDIEKAKPLFEKYIGAISSENRNENYGDTGVRFPKKDEKVHFNREMETAKASVYVSLMKEHDYSVLDNYHLYVIGQLLSKQYLVEIREKEGGTYGVRVSSSLGEIPYERLKLSMQFDCNPADQEKLTAIIYREINKVIKGEINEVNLEDIKKNLIKNREEAIEKNSFWMGNLKTFYQKDRMPLLGDDYTEIINGIDSKSIKKAAKKMLKKAVEIEIVMKSQE